ncbi:energy-coupling factor transporter transmembrane component T family protein [Peptostreptococcus sp.]|jgi:cobalt transport protein|uniref:energy-coupling factor transporter transmembrane component T family protein n=1 Tax=Peptostreptococcus sp. TaxID=1262 RepID=UPI0039938B6F
MKISAKNNRSYFKPITIFILMVLFSISTLIANQSLYLAMLILAILMEVLVIKKESLKSLACLLILFLLAKLINIGLGMGYWTGAIYAMLLITIKLSPLFILAKIFSSYSSNILMATFREIGLPHKLCISIAIFFRFLPEFYARLGQIHEGAKTRGLGFNLIHPIRSFEIFIVPLMYKVLDISDILTCSIITKGIDYPCKKTNYRKFKFSYLDTLVLAVGFLILGGCIWIKYKKI